MYKHKNGITLRASTKNDLEFLRHLKNETWMWVHDSTLISETDQEKWYASRVSSGHYSLLIMVKDSLSVGFVLYDIDWKNRLSKISASMFPSFSDLGFPGFAAGIDYAFEVFGVNRIEGEIIAYNVPAARLEIDQLGFVVEGRKRQSVYKFGSYHDSICIGMLRSDWISDPRVIAYKGSCSEQNIELLEKMTDRLRHLDGEK